MSEVKQNRFVVCHPRRGLYLGNGWWTESVEGRQVNCVPTYTGDELKDHPALNTKHVGPTGGYPRLIGHEVIDMAGDMVSQASAVRNGLVDQEWCPLPLATEG